MNWIQYAIFIAIVFLLVSLAFLDGTSEDNWDRGTSNYKESGK